MSCNVAQYRPILRSALQYPATSCKVMHAVLHSCSQLLAEFNKCVQYRIGVQDCYVVLCGVVQGHAIQHSIVQLFAESANVCNSGQRGAALRNIAQFCATLDAKIYSKLVQGEAPGHPKSMQIWYREPLGTPLVGQQLAEGVSGASRHVSGASQNGWRVPKAASVHRKRAPGNVRDRAKTLKIDAESCPEDNTIDFSRATRSRSSVGANFRRFRSILD